MVRGWAEVLAVGRGISLYNTSLGEDLSYMQCQACKVIEISILSTRSRIWYLTNLTDVSLCDSLLDKPTLRQIKMLGI